jgi:hypothetical protein
VAVVGLLATLGKEEPFLPVPVGGVTASVPDRVPFAMNLMSADAIWSGVALVVTPRDDASVAGWSFEKANPSEPEQVSPLQKPTLLKETKSPEGTGASGDGSCSGIGVARRRLTRSMNPPPVVAPWVSIFGVSAAGLG